MQQKSYNHLEEKLNTYSHAIGVILGIMGFFILYSSESGNTKYSSASVIIYSFCFVILFAASTLYHATTDHDLKAKFRILDHISIYLLIAGTYTPVALITLEQSNGWLIFTIVWAIALIGALLKLFFTGKFEVLSLLLYLAMGWLIVLDFSNLVENTSIVGLQLLMLGGAFYTFGILFYAWKRIPYNHFIWHLFVLGGAISHWLFIYYHVI